MVDHRQHLRPDRGPTRPADVSRRGRRPAGAAKTLLDKSRGPSRDIFGVNTDERPHGSRLRWLISTCLAALVGLLAAGGVIYGHLGREQSADWMPKLEQNDPEIRKPIQVSTLAPEASQLAQKTDKAMTMTGGLSTRHIIHEPIEVRKGPQGRPFIAIKPYAKVVARLATSPPPATVEIPPFNPVRLFAQNQIEEQQENAPETASESDVAVKIVELLGGILPEEDGQELDGEEVGRIVAKTGEELSTAADLRKSSNPDQIEAPKAPQVTKVALPPDPVPPQTSVLVKTVSDPGENDEVEGQETRGIRVNKGETLFNILRREGAEVWQAREIIDAANTTFPVAQLGEGHQLKLTLVPSANNANRMEPLKLSVFTEAGQHRVTVIRNESLSYIVASSPLDTEAIKKDDEEPTRATIYHSLYHAGLLQNLPPDLIELIIRVYSSDVDFRRRVKEGDAVELLFDLREDDKVGNGQLGELLFMSINLGIEQKKFYRFRSPDGRVDYFDEEGNNSRKFLLQRPVIGPAQFTSGYGVRTHPIARVARMHTGIDWSAAAGTPIVAAGNGVIEEVTNKGQFSYGNYIRIRHANGYKTAYAHMQRFAPGVHVGMRVRQNQIIGYVGNTGYSTAPHLHFEVLVNNSFMDPRRVPADRERKLGNRELLEFGKERVRIDALLNRPAVYTYVTHTSATLAKAAKP